MGFWVGNLQEIEHLEDPDIDRRIILKCTIGWENVVEIHLDQDKEKW